MSADSLLSYVIAYLQEERIRGVRQVDEALIIAMVQGACDAYAGGAR